MVENNWLHSVFGEALLRPSKPRETGMTMVMDKGLGPHGFDDLMETAHEFIDHLKFPYGTTAFMDVSYLEYKLQVCFDHDILVYPGGTLFEVAHSAGKTNQYFDCLNGMGFPAVEISSGTIDLSPNIRSELITRARERELTVVSEVGKKDPDRQPEPAEMARQVSRDLESGSRYVIIESRESGKGIGIYDHKGEVREDLVDELVEPLDRTDRLIWEAPLTNQQGYLIRRFGRDVNLGNIPSASLLAVEALRWGLRWETAPDKSPLIHMDPVKR